MYIFFSAITSMIIGLFLEINLSALDIRSEIPTIITVVVMGCFILYDNKRNRK